MTREIIRNAETLPTLDSSAVQRVKRYGKTSQVAEGKILIEQGKPLGHFIVVLEGEAVVELTNQIGTELIATHGPGEFFGDINMLSERPSLIRGRMVKAGSIVTVPVNSSIRNLFESGQ